MDAKPNEKPTTLRMEFAVVANTVGPGTEVLDVDRGELYVVKSRELHVDAQRQLALVLELRPAMSRSIKWFENVSRKQSWLPGLVAFIAFIILVALAYPVYSAFNNRDVALAICGGAIIAVPWLIPFVCTLAVFFRAWPARRRIGIALCAVACMVALYLGVGLGFLWHALFVRVPLEVWPTDYARLATAFGDSATSLFAVAAVYAPAIVLVLKILKLESLGKMSGKVLRKPGDD